jgi:hypothetical protein
MSGAFQLPKSDRLLQDTTGEDRAATDRKLKSFRYVVASVNDDALSAWSDLWNELKGGVTPAGAVTPQMQEGFKPACGWPEFLEKFWLLKHYLDYTHRFCTESTQQPRVESPFQS